MSAPPNLVTLHSAGEPAAFRDLLAPIAAQVTQTTSLTEAALQLAQREVQGILLTGGPVAEELSSLLREGSDAQAEVTRRGYRYAHEGMRLEL